MKRFILLLLLFPLILGCKREEGARMTCRNVLEVAGRQGVATDGQHYYVSGSTALYRYTLSGELEASNESPFEEMEGEVNHIGDIDVHDGKIFAGCEYFVDGKGENIQVAVYDAATLRYLHAIRWEPASGQTECCGIAVDPQRGRVWMSDWVDGHALYAYDLATEAYLGKVELDPAPGLQQGICMMGDRILISADDGDADKGEHDRLYSCRPYGKAGALQERAQVSLFRVMDDFRRPGEIEGLTWDPEKKELTVLSNRGARIILGMPKGFYEGYDREIHELFVYSK